MRARAPQGIVRNHCEEKIGTSCSRYDPRCRYTPAEAAQNVPLIAVRGKGVGGARSAHQHENGDRKRQSYSGCKQACDAHAVHELKGVRSRVVEQRHRQVHDGSKGTEDTENRT